MNECERCIGRDRIIQTLAKEVDRLNELIEKTVKQLTEQPEPKPKLKQAA